MQATIAALAKLLNVEGYPVLSVLDERTVQLDERLLREQFQLSKGSSPE